MLLRLVFLALLALQASAAQYTLYHRYADKGAKYAERGVVTVDGGKATYEASEGSPATSENAWYQVAILVGGEYMTASTPSCFASAPAHLTIFFTGQRPSGIEYKPEGKGKCSEGEPFSLPSSPLSVSIKTPHIVASPSLGVAQEVAADGKSVEPEPEKSFFQKYWMAIVAALLFIATMMGPDEPPKGAAKDAPKRLK